MYKKIAFTLVCLGALCLSACTQPQSQNPGSTDGWVDIPIDNSGEGELFVPTQTTGANGETTAQTQTTAPEASTNQTEAAIPTEPTANKVVEPTTGDKGGSQETKPAVSETTPSVAPETTAPTVPETTAPVTPETTAPTVPETTAPVIPETTEPVAPETTVPTVPETTVEATEPTLPTEEESKGKTAFEIYNSLPGELQAEFFASFATPADFFAWYNAAKADHESENPPIIIDGNGTIDLGELKDQYGKNGN